MAILQVWAKALGSLVTWGEEEEDKTRENIGFCNPESSPDHESINADRSLKNKVNIQAGQHRAVPIYSYYPRIIVNSASVLLNIPIWVLYYPGIRLEALFTKITF